MGAPPVWLVPIGDGVSIDVLVVPRASRSRIAGVHDDRLKVQVAAPPADGAANEALIALFAQALGVKKSAVAIASGHGNRRKRVHVEGIGVKAVLALLIA